MKRFRFLPIILALCVMLSSCGVVIDNNDHTTTTQNIAIEDIKEPDDKSFEYINGNVPEFTKEEYTTNSFERYSELDSLGRCGTAYACVGRDIMPTQERGSIGSVKPSGWHTVKYDNVDGKYLYNRCHLIAYMLSAENANERNLITGTRYMNVDGMLPFEDEVADYVTSTGNHVLYRVTPIFKGDELVCRGVQMEAYSVEDNGDGVQYNVFCYNIQPGITIDYKTGDSTADNESSNINDSEKQTYIININTKKFHTQKCPHAEDISDENKRAYIGSRNSLINNGFVPCGACKP